ncbi:MULTISPECIES: S-methyl-5-thioribose kinase [unclassified Cobetia]|uniref:S-methyl-5-thioribose kinase n=1 Tax=unclassified Cobetia TaxID=2609414 RepID=UPI002097D11A|nr:MULTISPECIES: S-methyl-5-thioribose kinase [unclassified Cobetia]MCO7233913.1 S-methyl-5-thioribose kinase [Cobetia sp. Dlab-2-AX]MCO7237197.1 S-methyl-5-thioribose kinase [Cobetia sp. Dlab-2-U]
MTAQDSTASTAPSIDYQFRDNADVIAFARQHVGARYPAFATAEELQVEEIGDGNINYVYRVCTPDRSASVIVKQGLPWVRIIGESWPLSLVRVRIEAETLRFEADCAPDLVPALHHFDEARSAIVMEDIGDHRNLRHAFLERTSLPRLGEQMGRFLATTLYLSSDLALDAHDKKARVARFINPDQCKITEDLFFIDPFCDHERNSINPALRADAEALWQDAALKVEVAELKQRFLSAPEALLHGDLHAGSIFVREDSTKVIDPEFGFFGPAGFDIGSWLAALWLAACAHTELEGEQGDKRDYLAKLRAQAVASWESFAREYREQAAHSPDASFAAPGVAERLLSRMLRDALGYAGCELIRRTVGLAHILELESISDETTRARAERRALALGRELIMARESLSDIDAIDALVARHLA